MLKKPPIIVKNLASVTLGQLFSGLLFMTSIALIARYLGTNRFGDYSYVMAFVIIFQFVADLGIASIFIREVAQERSRLEPLLGNLKSLYWILSLFSAIAIIFGIQLTTDGHDVHLAAYPAAVAAVALFHAFGYVTVFRAFEQMEINSTGLVLSRLTFLLLVIPAIKLKMGLIGIFTALALSSLALWWAYYLIITKKYTRPKLSFDLSIWRFLLREGAPTGGTLILRKASWHVDIFMLKAFATSAAVGLFSSIYQIVQILHLIPFTLAIPFLPVFSRLSQTNPKQLHNTLKTLLKLTWLVTLPLAIWITFTAHHIMTSIYGADFSLGADGLRLIIWTIPFLFPTSFFFLFFTAIGRQKGYLICVAIAVVINVLANFILIPKIGYLAACWATILSDFSLYWLSIFQLKRFGFSVANAKLVGIPAIGSALSGISLIPYSGTTTSIIQAIPFVVLAILVYTGFILICGYIKKEELLSLIHPTKV